MAKLKGFISGLSSFTSFNSTECNSWVLRLENKIIINQIYLTFKIAIYKSRIRGSCNISYIINKLKLIKKIEYNITFFNERKIMFNIKKWAGIQDYLI